MSIKQYLQGKSLSGVLTVWSFVLFIVLGVIAVAIFIMVPPTKTGWLIPICEWLFPILFVLFAISSRIRVREIDNALDDARTRTETEKIERIRRERERLLQEEQELLVKKVALHQEMVEILQLEKEMRERKAGNEQV